MSKTHDYTNAHRGFGHDITYRPIDSLGRTLHATGWGAGIKKADFILLTNGAGETRYMVDSITYFADPADMWNAQLLFAPRQGGDA